MRRLGPRIVASSVITRVGSRCVGSCVALVKGDVKTDAQKIPLGLCASIVKERTMLYTIAVILLVLWLFGLVSGYAIGAFIHVVLVFAVVLLLVGLLSGRRVV